MIADDQRAVIGGGGDLVVGEDVFADAVVGELPPWLVGILLPEQRLHAAEREAEAFELGGIDFNTHRRRAAALHTHLPHALNLRELLLQDR